MKPISFTASKVLAETLAANDWKDVSVSMLAPTILPGTVTNIKNLISTIHLTTWGNVLAHDLTSMMTGLTLAQNLL